MQIIDPKVELIEQSEKLISHVARCARVCYKRETGNDEKLVENLYKNHHWSMFRHETHYCMLPADKNVAFWINQLYEVSKLLHQKIVGIDIELLNRYYPRVFLIVFNGNWRLDNIELANQLAPYEVSPKEFSNISEQAFNMMRYTFNVTTQISTSRELNRVSPNSISEQSTRYVYEDGTLCRPHWLIGYQVFQHNAGNYVIYKDGREDKDINHKVLTYIKSCDSSFNNYEYLVKAGVAIQDARGVLPIDTATRCIYTYSINEWRNIIDLRYYGTTGKPHPNAKIIAGMIREQLIDLGYVL